MLWPSKLGLMSPASLHPAGLALPQNPSTGQALGLLHEPGPALLVWTKLPYFSYKCLSLRKFSNANQGLRSSQLHPAPPSGQLSPPFCPRVEDLIPLCRAHVQLSYLELAELHDARKGKFTINSHNENDEQEVSQGANTYLNTLCLLSFMTLLYFYLQDLVSKKKKNPKSNFIKSPQNTLFKTLLKQTVCFV